MPRSDGHVLCSKQTIDLLLELPLSGCLDAMAIARDRSYCEAVLALTEIKECNDYNYIKRLWQSIVA